METWLYKGVYRCEYCTVFSVLCSLEYINYVLMCELLYGCVTAPHNVKHWQNAGLEFSVVVFSLSDNQELIANKN